MASATQTSQNIKRSVQEYLAGLSLGAPLLFDTILDQVPTSGAWVDAVWRRRNLTHMASPQKRAEWVLTLDCWSRIADDPLQATLDALVDAVIDGCRDKRIDLKSYAVPAAPVSTGYYVRLQVDGDDQLPNTDLVNGRSVSVAVQYHERT